MPKESMTEADRFKREYYGKIEQSLKKALKYFKLRDFKFCYYHLEEILATAAHAYDLEMLRFTHSLAA